MTQTRRRFLTIFFGTLIVGVLFAAGVFIYGKNATEPDSHKLIELLSQPIPGKVIEPETTEDLLWYFYGAEIQSMPRVFVKKLPADFAENGDPVLFGKIFTALMLRANEMIFIERYALKLLAAAFQKNQPWTLKEKMFFDRMVEKYDCVLDKDTSVRLRCLFSKVDVIPVSLGVIQAGIETDWGRVNMDAPFGEKMWYDTETYAPKKFDSLIDAVDSYALLLNSAIPYYRWRVARDLMRPHAFKGHGSSFARLLEAYRPEDKFYTDKLMSFYRETYLMNLDKAGFKDGGN